MKRISFYPTLLVSAVLVAGCSKVQEPTPDEELAAAKKEFAEAKKEWAFVEPLAEKALSKGMERCFERWSRANDIKLVSSFQHVTKKFNERKVLSLGNHDLLVMDEFVADLREKGSEWEAILAEEKDRELKAIGAYKAEDRFIKAEARLAAAENAVKDAM